MENIMPFEYEGKKVKVIKKDDVVWFVLKDVCDILELTNPSRVRMSLHEDDVQKMYTKAETSDKRCEFLAVNESGLYQCVFQSRKPKAKEFSRWITKEVIPSIRKTGSYSTNQAITPATLLLQQAQVLVEQEQRLTAIENNMKRLEAQQKTVSIDYFTIGGYCSLKNIKIPLSKAKLLGRKATKLSKEYDVEIGKIHDPKYGTVNTYDISILDELFCQ